MDGVGKSINGISVVEGLGTKSAEKNSGGIQRSAVVDVGIRLDNPDQLLARMVEVEFDRVGRRTDGLITSELELFDEVFVGVLGHLASLIGIKEDIVDVERSSNKGLLIGIGDGNRRTVRSSKGADGPETFTKRTNIKIDLNFVVLYEPLVPPLSGYLSAFSHTINYIYYVKILLGTRLYLKPSLKMINLLRPITI